MNRARIKVFSCEADNLSKDQSGTSVDGPSVGGPAEVLR
jgi:hypothetical protein